MTYSSPILQALGYDTTGLKQLVAPLYASGCRGEAYFSIEKTRSMTLTDRQVMAPVVSTSSGGALRRIQGLTPDLVTFTGLTQASLIQAKADLESIPLGAGATINAMTSKTDAQPHYYTSHDVFAGKTDDDCKRMLQEIDDYLRSADPRVSQVSAGLVGKETSIVIARYDGQCLSDYRPYVSLRIEVVMTENGRREQGAERIAKRITWAELLVPRTWRPIADRALEMAKNNLTSIPAPSGNHLELVVTNGWGGVILHEAFGHGLEADFHRKGLASFQGKMGQRIAAKGVNVVENGTLADEVGTLHFDDEGNPTHNNTLVEDGILTRLITDDISAHALGLPLTGNGRRESFASPIQPRMTNTYMLPGSDDVERLMAEVKDGIYCSSFSGGEVNIVTGKFVFMANEARRIENGKLGAFIKGASLQGMGNKAYLGVTGVANDMALAAGFCGKAGQTVTTTVGQPTIRIAPGNITVGGTGA